MVMKSAKQKLGLANPAELEKAFNSALELRKARAADDGSGHRMLKKKDDLVRVQLDFPQERIDELNNVMNAVGLDTRKDLFNNALSIFAWAVGEKEKGRAIISVDEDSDSFKELVMHPLETAASKARTRRAKIADELMEKEKHNKTK